MRWKGLGRSWEFAEFVLCHAECADEVMEAKLHEDSIVCWCLRCGVLRVFGMAREANHIGAEDGRAYRRPGESYETSGGGQ